MERLHPVGCLVLGLSLLLGVDAGATERNCSLTVTVSSATGARVEALLAVQEQNGQVTERETEPGKGTADFCDLGITPVTVKVGSDGSCNQVVVKDVPLIWDETQRLMVTYQPDACPADSPQLLPLKCPLMLRIKDARGAIPKAIVRSPEEATDRTSDEYGRMLLYIVVGRRVEISIDAKGYISDKFEAVCPSGIDPSEKTVVLKKQGNTN